MCEVNKKLCTDQGCNFGIDTAILLPRLVLYMSVVSPLHVILGLGSLNEGPQHKLHWAKPTKRRPKA